MKEGQTQVASQAQQGPRTIRERLNAIKTPEPQPQGEESPTASAAPEPSEAPTEPTAGASASAPESGEVSEGTESQEAAPAEASSEDQDPTLSLAADLQSDLKEKGVDTSADEIHAALSEPAKERFTELASANKELRGKVEDLTKAQEAVAAENQKLKAFFRQQYAKRQQAAQNGPAEGQAAPNAEAIPEALRGYVQGLENQVRQLTSWASGIQQREQQALQAQQNEAEINGLYEEAAQVRPHTFPGLDPEMHAEILNGSAETFDDLIVDAMIKYDVSAQQALPIVRKVIGKIAEASYKAGRARGKKLKEQDDAPAATVEGVTGDQGEGAPGSRPVYTKEQRQQVGYRSAMEALTDGYAKFKRKGIQPAGYR